MNNKLVLTALLVQILFFCITNYSQTESSITFPNGVTVAHMTGKGSGLSSGGTYDSKTNILHQFFFDENSRTYFGYDLEIFPVINTTKFRLLLKSVTGKPDKRWQTGKGFRKITLPNLPYEVTVDDGDIVSLNLLENPQTKEKIKEFIVVTRKKNVGPRFAEKYIPRDFTHDDIHLKLKRAKLFVNGKRLGNSGGVSGSNVYFYIRGKGRFILSPFQRKGYKFQKIGTALNNRINFNYDGTKYEITSSLPVLGIGGKWHIWVMFDKDFTPPRLFDKAEVAFGASDTKYLFSKN